MTLIAKRYALFGEQSGLRIPARNEPPRMVDDAVTGEIPVQLGAVQNAADEARVFRPSASRIGPFWPAVFSSPALCAMIVSEKEKCADAR